GVYAQLVRSQAIKKREKTSATDTEAADSELDMASGVDAEESSYDHSSEPLASSQSSEKHTSYTSLPPSDRADAFAKEDGVVSSPTTKSKPHHATSASRTGQSKSSARNRLSRRLRRKKGAQPTDHTEDSVDEEDLVKAERERLAKASTPFRRLAKLSLPNKKYIMLGALFAALDGAIMPLFSIIFSKLLWRSW
ncbi:hypothetical protein IWQ60_012596, partial [Tieghemiomyces parasiticus]